MEKYMLFAVVLHLVFVGGKTVHCNFFCTCYNLVRYPPRQKNGSLPICSVCNWTNYNPWIISVPFLAPLFLLHIHTHTRTRTHGHRLAHFPFFPLTLEPVFSLLVVSTPLCPCVWCLCLWVDVWTGSVWAGVPLCPSLTPFCTNSGFCVQYLG